MIRTSEQIAELNDAFAKAQAKFEAAVKAQTNPAYRSKYADISSIIDATLEHLNAEGIGVRQHPSLEYKQVGDGVEAYVTVTTRLAHKSGQWEESDMSIPAVQRDKFDAHSTGSACSYACRYALQGILCVRREDEDGNAAAGIGSSEAAKAVGQKKVEELTAKAKKDKESLKTPVAALFYVWEDASQTATVTGDRDLLSQHRLALKPFWNGNAQAIVMKADELENMKFYFESKGVEFRQLKGTHA